MILFILDIDDTLTLSEDQHQSAYIDSMKEVGVTQIDTYWRGYAHHTDSFILKENFERNHNEDFSFSIVPDFEENMTSKMRLLQPVDAIPGVHDRLEALQQQGIATCFATGSFLKPALLKLNQARIAHDENVVVGSNEIFEREGIVQKAIDQACFFYGTSSFEHKISVGDGIWDLKTAQNLDLHFIGIGQKNLSDFREAGIKYHMNDWTQFSLKDVFKTFEINDQ